VIPFITFLETKIKKILRKNKVVSANAWKKTTNVGEPEEYKLI